MRWTGAQRDGNGPTDWAAVGVSARPTARFLPGRRDDELRSLLARGLPPHRAGTQAVREAVLPALVGLAVGGVAGRLLVRAFGPAPDLPDAAVRAALAVIGCAGVAALLTVGEVYAAAGTGVLLASHDPVVVANADRVVRLSDGQVVDA